ncbi:hypothetical protein NC651_000543 [Populus alba x Populus x berolinensis]|nr:hypothetical protein NC651_000543 [Populus alba x Populus x berolinensis]
MNVTITFIFLSNLFFYPKKKRMTVTEEVTIRITISPLPLISVFLSALHSVLNNWQSKQK